jgi:hypothetical protein
MNSKRLTTCFFVLYATARILSFFFQPSTLINSAITGAIAITVAYFLIKKSNIGWYIIAGEIILGGTGSYFHLFGLSLRTILLILSISIYSVIRFRDLPRINLKTIAVLSLLCAAALGAIRGFYLGNKISNIIPDTVPYFFILYYFPLQELLKNNKFVEFCKSALVAAVVGEALFIGFTFIGYATKFFALQDLYYHWFRDIAGGKITLVQFNFYRLVLNEHLLLVPTLLYFIYTAIAKKTRLAYLLSLLLIFILSINLTRIYLLALAVGCLIIIIREKSLRALALSAAAALSFLVIFSSLYLVGSGGKSFGLEVFGLRLQSIVSPNIEDSSLSRLLLLPKIIELIKQHPVLGNGLGTTVTVFSPVFKTLVTTPNFDWGYLEMIAELGIVGTLFWSIFIGAVLVNIKKLPSWQLPVFFSFLFINLTSPALFHVLGVTLFAFLLASSSDASAQPTSLPLRN